MQAYVNPIFESMMKSLFGETPYPETVRPPEVDIRPEDVIIDLHRDSNGEYVPRWVR